MHLGVSSKFVLGAVNLLRLYHKLDKLMLVRSNMGSYGYRGGGRGGEVCIRLNTFGSQSRVQRFFFFD